PVRYSLTCFCTAQFAIRSPAFALPSSLFAHLLLHCPVRYSLTCFCTAKVHRTFSCRKQPQDLLVSKAATGPSRVESSHRTFSCRKQPQDLLVSSAALSGMASPKGHGSASDPGKSPKKGDFAVAMSFATGSVLMPIWRTS